MRKHIRLKSALLSCLVALAVLLVSGPAFAAEKQVPKVDSFVIFLDHSGSMGMTHEKLGQKKIDVALNVLQELVNSIPELGYQSAVYTFAPYAEYQAPATFSRSATSSALTGIETDFPIYGRLTPMGDGFEALDPTIANLKKKAAVIIVSDGLSNVGKDPVAVATSIASKYGDDVCFHVISMADTAEGQATLDKIQSLTSSCSCTQLNAVEALKDKTAMNDFVECVFYDTVTIEEAKPIAAPAAPVAPATEEVLVFRSVNFDFDKSNIRPDMEPVLDEAASILGTRSDPFVLEGHTCSIGPEAYNQGLSERRANSVKSYLVNKGINPSRITTIGHGESQPKYDNNTREGRALNRRVEIHLK